MANIFKEGNIDLFVICHPPTPFKGGLFNLPEQQ